MPKGIFARKPLSDKHKEAIKLSLMGRKITWGKKLSDARLGYKPTLIARHNMSVAHIGHRASEETIRKKREQSLGSKNPFWKGGKPNCKTCGKRLSSYKSIYCAEHWIKPIGGLCNFWKGGVTPINTQIRTSNKYKNWRKSVFIRDEYTCQFCGEMGKNIHAHHIRPFALFPNLRFDIMNGITLCEGCHKTTPTFGNNAQRYSAIDKHPDIVDKDGAKNLTKSVYESIASKKKASQKS